MKHLVCAFAVLLAVPAQAQLYLGADVGQGRGNDARWDGASGSVHARVQHGVLTARLNALEVLYEHEVAPDPTGTRAVRIGERTETSSSVELGVAVALYRGAGIGAGVGGRLIYNGAEARERYARDATTKAVFTTVEAFAPGPHRARLHLRAEGLPRGRSEFDPDQRAGFGLLRVQIGASVPLRL